MFCFDKGGAGFPDLNILKGSKFQAWLGSIAAALSTLKQDTLTKSIIELTEGFKGWNDESDLDKLVGKLQALEKNYYDYVIEEKKTNKTEVAIVNSKKVFVVHGRNNKIRDSVFQFLRALDVQPIEWDEAKHMTGKPSPYISEVLDVAFNNAQAIVVLLTPDDEAKLKEEFIDVNDDDYEKILTGQARPNVIFEAGMAFGRDRDRTILLEFGKLRPFSDIGGINTIRMNNTDKKRMSFCNALKTAKVSINIEGKTDWLSEGNFNL